MNDPSPREAFRDLVSRDHRLSVEGGELAYTTETGRFRLFEESVAAGVVAAPAARADIFLAAYVRQVPPAQRLARPVVFVFNGGPGSASMWLHLGLLGPRRVLAGDAGALQPPPYALADNPHTLLRDADLVFIDPIDTGFSRTTEGTPAAEFHGVTRDIEAVTEVIRAWSAHHHRWMSPTFIAGESYGTIRAVGVANRLQRTFGLYLNGLLLLSTVLHGIGDYRGYAADMVTALRLPTYAAVAHHHGKHPGRSLPQVLAEAEAYATGDYLRVLAAGSRLPAQERHAAVTALSSLTGLPADFIDRCDLRVHPGRFYTELLRDQGLVVSRMDGRFTGWNPDRAHEVYEEDPALQALLGPYHTAFNQYVSDELGYDSELPFLGFNYHRVHPWQPREPAAGGVSMLADLGYAMRANPHLRVHVGSGYLDGSTPYWASEYELAHLPIPHELAGNIERRFYPAGHMMYIHEPSRLQQSQDLAEFIRRAS